MKNLRLLTTTLAVFALFSISDTIAQPKNSGNWQERMHCERIAFITSELNLSPEEAQTFWPVYNQIAQEKQEAQKVSTAAFRALKKATEEGTASEKEISKLLEDYLLAKDLCHKSWKDNGDKYRKVLSAEKVAKLYIAEEKFRRQHIRNMKGSKQGAGRPGGQNGAGRPGVGR